MPFYVALGSAAFLAIAIVAFGLRRPDYSHLAHTISELGEFGADDSALVSWAVFFPVGVALAAIAGRLLRGHAAAPRSARPAAALAASVAAGYLVAAVFPCDPGSPLSGSGRQAVHNLGGAIEYFGGGFALIWLARVSGRFRWFFAAAALITLSVAFGVSAPELAQVRGLVQRIGETALFASIALAAWPAKP